VLFAQCPNDPNCNAVVGTISAYGGVYGASSTYHGIFGVTTSSGDNAGVLGFGPRTGVMGQSQNGNGVYGLSFSPNDSGVWGNNAGGGYGVSGSTTSDTASAVWGANYGAGPGVRGTAFGSGFAGLFEGTVSITGDLNVAGTITKGAGGFRIDHPLDPAHKFLSHCSWNRRT